MKLTKRDFLIGAGTGLAGAGALLGAQMLRPRGGPGGHSGSGVEPGTDAAPQPREVLAPDPGAGPPWSKVFYAQFAEDLNILGLLKLLEVLRQKTVTIETYIDIGTYHPAQDNNTYMFYQLGARGVLVEPNVALIPTLKEVRPEDTVLNIGIGITDQAEADYYLIKGMDTMNTFSKEQADQLQVERVVKMPLVNVNKVIAQHLGKTPDYFSIDVEGLDFAILKTLDFTKYRPKFFCVETIALATLKHNAEISKFMATKGFVPVAQTVANTIYIDKNIHNPG